MQVVVGECTDRRRRCAVGVAHRRSGVQRCREVGIIGAECGRIDDQRARGSERGTSRANDVVTGRIEDAGEDRERIGNGKVSRQIHFIDIGIEREIVERRHRQKQRTIAAIGEIFERGSFGSERPGDDERNVLRHDRLDRNIALH